MLGCVFHKCWLTREGYVALHLRDGGQVYLQLWVQPTEHDQERSLPISFIPSGLGYWGNGVLGGTVEQTPSGPRC